ncbi:hypothetical protein D3C72_2075860 [compost metagenome]
MAIGTAASTQLTGTPSIMSTARPVGSSLPVLAPATSWNFSHTGAALPATPSMAAWPS